MKKLLSLALCLALLALFAVPVMAEAPTPITWLTTGDTAAKVIGDGDRIVATINEKLGIQLTVQYVPEGNVEKVNVAMASGDFPDIVTGQYGSSATQSWIENGMVLPLNDYLESYVNIANWLKPLEWSAVDGQYYGLPFINQYSVANSLIMMRQDWLDNLGMKYPTNLDEMKAVLLAFTNGDPDGDGQANSVGYTGVKPTVGRPVALFDWVFYAYGRQYSDYELDADGNVIPWFETASFASGMNYLRELWEAGAIDKEFMLNDASKVEEKFYQGKAGAASVALFRHVSRHENNLKAVFPEASIAYGKPPVGPDGVSFGLNPQGKTGMMTCVTAACKNPDKALAFLDFMVSPEGNDLVRKGIEGIHYTMNGEEIVYNEEERAKDAFSPNGWAHALAWGSLYWPVEVGFLPATEPMRDRALETMTLATEAQKPALIKQKTSLEILNGAALDDIYNQYFLDVLQGKLGVEDGQQKLSAEWRSQGGDELLAELNAAYKAQ